MDTVTLATRGSPLALRQANLVADSLHAAWPELEVNVLVVRTQGDVATGPLDQIGGQGIFVTEVEQAVADGRADIAVHSAKDLPSTMPEHLTLAAVPLRADPRDGLVGCRLADLTPGGLIATGSARRRSQLAYLRPDLIFTDLRGNMERRVSRGEDGSVSAVIVAMAAMERLDWLHRVTDVLSTTDVLPQAGQGAIAVQCRVDDKVTHELVAPLNHEPSARTLQAERAVLAALGGSCTLPVGAWAEASTDASQLTVHGLLASGDGRTMIRMSRSGDDPTAVGIDVARALVIDGGGYGLDGFDAASLRQALASGSP
ncbi:MAG TPA: hydroxymethylbilane synthase [Acidimicrobiales bacterium]|jgi:hydroxymethylbilane synthase